MMTAILQTHEHSFSASTGNTPVTKEILRAHSDLFARERNDP
jgi:hypothetical protein